MSSIRLLLAFAETGRQRGFARAARELGLSPSAVAKSVGRLEQELGVRLFHRTTRSLGLTAEGEALYERCRRILDELDELQQAASLAASKPSGVLRLDAPITYGRDVILPLLAGMARQHPELRFDVRLSDEFADLVATGLDAVIRIGENEDSRLVARQFDRHYLGVYGSQEYFEQHGRPRTPDDLAKHDCAVFRLPTSGRERPWQFQRDGAPSSFQPTARYSVNEGEGLIRLAESGVALVQAPDYMARGGLAAGRLEEVLRRFRPKPMPISIVYPSQRHVPLRLRLLVDTLVARSRTRAGPTSGRSRA